MSESSESNICGNCRQPNIRNCKECGLSYCFNCVDDYHLSQCRSFEFAEFDKFQIFIKAKKDLEPGDVVLNELPFAVAPKLPIKSGYVPCVGCCCLIPQAQVAYCPECLWPACKSTCKFLQSSTTHGLECKILKLQKSFFSKTSFKNYRFDILLPLRILFVQTFNQNNWNSFLTQIEKNYDEKINTQSILNLNNEFLSFFEQNILNPLKEHESETGLIILPQKSKELLEKMIVYLKSQTIQINGSSPVEIFYGVANLIQHSCTPNSFLTVIDEQYKIAIRVNSPVSKNSPITISYVDLFQATYKRQSDLKLAKNLICTCPRCKDPTEFETYFSALRCLGTRKEPCGGNQLPVEPFNLDTIWICDKCKIELPNDQMIKFIKHLGAEVEKVFSKKPNIDDLEEFLAKLFMFLHPNHFYVCQIKLKLIKLYGDDLIYTKLDLCRTLINLVKKLCPNGSLFLGELLHELIEGKLQLAAKQENKNHLVKEISELLEESRQNLEARFDLKLSKVIEDDVAKFSKI